MFFFLQFLDSLNFSETVENLEHSIFYSKGETFSEGFQIFNIIRGGPILENVCPGNAGYSASIKIVQDIQNIPAYIMYLITYCYFDDFLKNTKVQVKILGEIIFENMYINCKISRYNILLHYIRFPCTDV